MCVLLNEGAVMRRLDGGARMRRLREGDERTPQPPGGDGAPPGGTRTSCQELADGGPTRANAELGCQKRGPLHRKTPRWRAERRRIFPKGRCALELPDAPSRRAIPSYFTRDGDGIRRTRRRKEHGRRSVGCALSVIPGREQSERTRNPYSAALRIMDSGLAG